MSNYPPGGTDKDLDTAYDKVAESVRDSVEVRYELRALVDDEVVYESDFFDEEDLEGNGFRKALQATETKVAELIDEKFDEVSNGEDE